VLPSGQDQCATRRALDGTVVEFDWQNPHTLLRAGVKQWPLTAAARKALAANSDDRNGTRAKCIPYGPPALMIEPVLTMIAIAKDTATFTTDIDGAAIRRVVHLDLKAHPPNLQPSPFGHSIGHWEGDTLVVDTIAFTPHDEGFGFGLPSSAHKHLEEHFRLSDDRRSLIYETIAEDPETLTEKTRFTAQLLYRPDLKPTGTPCDLDVAQRYLHEQ
jgi:hypothetical protein